MTHVLIVLEKLAKDEKNVDYNNVFFNIDDKPVVKSVTFLEKVGTLYDLLIYLLGNAKKILNSVETQIDFFRAIDVFQAWKLKLQIKVKNKKRKFLQNKKVF